MAAPIVTRRYQKHGFTKHRLYGVLINIIERCHNEKSPFYKNYGAKGVRVCDEWLEDRESFIKWALSNGWEPGLQIDKDIKAAAAGVPALLYSPDWCSVVTPIENNSRKINSRLLEVGGITKNLSEWARFYNIGISTILHRINTLKWSVEEAITTTGHKRRRKIKMADARRIREMRASGVSCKQIAEEYEMDVSNVFLIIQNKTWKDR